MADEGNGRRRSRALRHLVVLAVVALASGVASWMVASRVESPTQTQARARPPTPAPVTARITQGPLLPPISVAGTVERERTLTVPGGALATAVVTSVEVEVGAEIGAGQVLMRANGRPVFLLPGSFPLYREMNGGEKGDDVAAVQYGLAAAGLSIGSDELGTFGPGTKDALGEMYERAGYTAPRNGAAEEELDQLEAQLAAATVPPDPAVYERRRALRAARGPVLSRVEVVMTPELPAVVQGTVGVGELISDSDPPLATLGAGRVIVRAPIPMASADAIAVGAVGELTDAEGVAVTATVEEIETEPSPGSEGAPAGGAGEGPASSAPGGASPGAGGAAQGSSGGSDGPTVIMTTTGGNPRPGESVVVRFTDPDGNAKVHTLVPAAAVVARSNRSYLFVRDGSRFSEVLVEVVGTVGGTVAVTSLDPEQGLAEGAEIRVGTD